MTETGSIPPFTVKIYKFQWTTNRLWWWWMQMNLIVVVEVVAAAAVARTPLEA